ncbi:MAG: hypothetical protein LBV69_06410 [Bacteroidales bacterium]|jgi:hypothetical protein|nr:hypothetical protein [Bacteroidales bacterium]
MPNKIHFIKKFTQIANNEPFFSEIKEYDENEKLISLLEYDIDEIIIYEYIAEYSEAGRLIIEKNNYMDENSGEKKHYIYLEGELIQLKIVSEAGWCSTKDYNFDKNTNKLTITSFDESNKIEETVIIEYNDKKEVISKQVFDEDDKLMSMTKTSYNDNGKVLMNEEYDDKKKLEKSYNYSYNELGNVIQTIVYNGKGKIIDWSKNIYDEENKIIEQQSMSGTIIKNEYSKEEKALIETLYASNGAKIRQTKTLFDENNNIIEEHPHSFIDYQDDTIFKYEYVYYE